MLRHDGGRARGDATHTEQAEHVATPIRTVSTFNVRLVFLVLSVKKYNTVRI
jgi:hypothetical protein